MNYLRRVHKITNETDYLFIIYNNDDSIFEVNFSNTYDDLIYFFKNEKIESVLNEYAKDFKDYDYYVELKKFQLHIAYDSSGNIIAYSSLKQDLITILTRGNIKNYTTKIVNTNEIQI